MQSILVLGAGELGTSVLRHLVRLGSREVTLSALVRQSPSESPGALAKEARLNELRTMGITVVYADLVGSSHRELSQQLHDYDMVISCVGFAAGSDIQIKIAQAALDGQVKRFVPWQFGVDYDVIGRGSAQDLFDAQLEVRDLLRGQSKTEWIIVSTGIFMSLLFDKAFGVADLDIPLVRALGSWATAVTTTSPEDIGALTAAIVYTETPRFSNEVVYTAGDTVTYGQLAEIVERVMETQVQKEEWNVPYLKRVLADDPQDAIKKYRVVFGEGRGVSWDMEKSFNWMRGRQVTDIEHWLKHNLKRFGASSVAVSQSTMERRGQC